MVVFTLEELFYILKLTPLQIDDVQETIAFGLMWEIFHELRLYLLDSDRGLPPQEVAYVLENIPVSWTNHHRHISSPFGWRVLQGTSNFHDGIDLPMAIGTEVFATMSGTVVTSGFVGRAGHMIAIQSDCGRVVTRYLHLSQRLVSVGIHVERGDLIALSGNSGAETTSNGHLHFDIAIDGVRINPLYALP